MPRKSALTITSLVPNKKAPAERVGGFFRPEIHMDSNTTAPDLSKFRVLLIHGEFVDVPIPPNIPMKLL